MSAPDVSAPAVPAPAVPAPAASAPAVSAPAAGTTAGRPAIAPLPSPRAQLRQGRMTRRLGQLYAGLLLYGVSMAFMLRSGLGLDPWDVFHQGLSSRLPLSFGEIVIAVGGVVLLLWIPLRQWPGVGTVSNAIVIGLAVDQALRWIPAAHALPVQVAMLLAALAGNAVATAAYIGARLGPGPRDGLMTGLVRRTGWSVRVVRTSIEVSVLVVGWFLGGTVGIGTVVYALGIGPLVQPLLHRFDVAARPR